MWRLTQNEYGVLSTYVPRFEEMGLNANDRWEVRAEREEREERNGRNQGRDVSINISVLFTTLPLNKSSPVAANVQVPHICRVFFTPGDGMPRNEQAKAAMWLTRYVRRQRRRKGPEVME